MMGSQGGFASFGAGAGGGQGMFMSNNGSMMLGNANANGGQQGGLGVGINSNNNINNNTIGQNQQNGVQAQETGNSLPPAEYSLPGILHYLQSEWRRYEKDRNEWEIERAEMRARIALLEGERRGVENLKTDLMRRVKMLEYALRQERSKYLSSSSSSSNAAAPSASSAAAPAKNPLLQGLEKAAASSSGRSSPARSEDIPDGPAHGRNTSTLSFNPSTLGAGSTLMAGEIGSNLAGQLSRASSSAKDPRSRAKSREYLKQCLQEISYLTSASTLNPLPDRGNAPTSNAGGSSTQGPPRPRKTLLENVPAPQQQQEGQNAVSQGSLRRGPGSQLGLPNAGKSLRAGRSPLFASEPVMEEAAETEEEQNTSGQADSEASKAKSESESLTASETSTPLQQHFNDAHAPSADAQPLPNGVSSQDHAEGTPKETPSSGSSDSSESSSGSSQSQGSMGFSDESMTDQENDETEQVTAIFKPGGKDWEKLKEAGLRGREKREEERRKREDDAAIVSEAQAQLALTSERVNQLMSRSGRPVGSNSGSDKGDEDDLANLSLNAQDEDAAKAAADAAADSQMWKSKRVLRSHLDAVRAVAFDKNNLTLVSGSDDNTVKVWRFDPNAFNQANAKVGAESEPLVTLRGHSAAVTCLAISSKHRRIYSGSMDSSIRAWEMPNENVQNYPPFDKEWQLGTLVGHSQAVWDIAILPDQSDEEGLIATASADGTVKIWSTQDASGDKAPGVLQLSFDYFGTEPSPETQKERENLEKSGGLPVPTSVTACNSNLRLCAVAYTNSVVKLFEVSTGKQVRQLKSDETYDGTPGTQINKVVTHSTLPLAITAHEDTFIRMFDIETGECTMSMAAHLDAVISLDIDPSGLMLVSGGHDCSVRFWDIGRGYLEPQEEKNAAAVCKQEVSSHRKKGEEGVLAVKYHPTAPLFASGGADGVIRIYG